MSIHEEFYQLCYNAGEKIGKMKKTIEVMILARQFLATFENLGELERFNEFVSKITND